MLHEERNSENLSILCVILGGGRGTRLYPLTKNRAKPAVPLLGQYRLIDIPLSNCLNSGLEVIYVLTQFNSESLLRHITDTYKFDMFSEGRVQVLPAQQTLQDASWYQGTADAVRQNLLFITAQNPEYTIILSGDQLYRMDFNRLIRSHRASQSDITVCCKPFFFDQCRDFGIMRRDKRGRLLDFVEKPEPKDLSDDFIDAGAQKTDNQSREDTYLASIGIYVFNTDVLVQALNRMKDSHDFGSEIFPFCAGEYDINTYLFDGYWQDIGTIGNFYRAHISFVEESDGFQIYEKHAPIYTHPRFLPPPRIKSCSIENSLISTGSDIRARSVSNSIIGLRTRIGKGTEIKRSIIMGADFIYEPPSREEEAADESPSTGIGSACKLEGCIIDKNASIGDGVKIRHIPGRPDEDNELYSVRDGIVVIPKDTVVGEGTVI